MLSQDSGNGTETHQRGIHFLAPNTDPDIAVDDQVVDEPYETSRVMVGAHGQNFNQTSHCLADRLIRRSLENRPFQQPANVLFESAAVGRERQGELDDLIEIRFAALLVAVQAESLVTLGQIAFDHPAVDGQGEDEPPLGQHEFDALQQLQRLRRQAAVQIVDENDDLRPILGFDVGSPFERLEGVVVEGSFDQRIVVALQFVVAVDHLLGHEPGLDFGKAGHGQLRLAGKPVGHRPKSPADVCQALGCLLQATARLLRLLAFPVNGMHDGGHQRDDRMVFLLVLPGVEPDGNHLGLCVFQESFSLLQH